jgi:hypothetical protein
MREAKNLNASVRLLSSGKRLNSPLEGDGTVCVTCGTSEGHRWCMVKGSDRFNCYKCGMRARFARAEAAGRVVQATGRPVSLFPYPRSVVTCGT